MTIKDKVKAILTQLPEMRSSDKKLLLYIWGRQGLVLTPEQQQIFMEKCLPAESITRARRIVREENPELRGSEEVEQQRHNKAVDYKYNAEVHLNTVEYYTGEDGMEYVKTS